MGCFTFVRLMTLSFNLLIFLAGLTLLATGTWTSVSGSPFLQTLAPFSGDAMRCVNVGFFGVATGALLALLGLLGCWGAQQESKCLLLTFSSIVLVIFVAEAAAGVLVLAYSSFAEAILGAWATPALRDYGSDPVVTSVWNATMTELRCCGFNNYTDFIGSRFETESSGSLPLSCCWSGSAACGRDAARRSGVQGCAKGILTTLGAHASTVGGIAAGTGLLQVAAMSVSMYLYFHLDNGDHSDSLGGS